MNRILGLSVLVLATMAYPLFSQETQPAAPAPAPQVQTTPAEPAVAEPQFSFEFHYLDATGKLSILEKVPAKLDYKVRALGYGGAKQFLKMDGPEVSPLRFKAGALPTFVVRGIAKGMNPTDFVSLARLEIKKGERRLETAKGGGFTHYEQRDQSENIALTITPYGTESVKIVVAKPLEAGEYMFSTKMQVMQWGYCFGVDGDPAAAK